MLKSFMITSIIKMAVMASLCLSHGDTDPIPLDTAEHINKAIPHSRLSVIERCGHFPYVEQPEVFFKAIDEFLHPIGAL